MLLWAVKSAVEKAQVECGSSLSTQVYLHKCFISYSYYPNFLCNLYFFLSFKFLCCVLRACGLLSCELRRVAVEILRFFFIVSLYYKYFM